MFKFTKDIGSDEYWDPTCLALSEDEKCLFTACNDSKTFHQWNIAVVTILAYIFILDSTNCDYVQSKF